jgi:Vitamin K-dependent gamma-carboxylase
MPTTSTLEQIKLRRPHLEHLRELRKRLVAFLFPGASDAWLAILRIGLGLQMVLVCLSLRRDWSHLFARSGGVWINRDLLEVLLAAQAPFVPRFGWLLSLGDQFGINEQTVLSATWICSLVAASGLLVGFCSRTCAILAWFFQQCAVNSGGLLSYGMDNFTTIGLFYLMLAPFPDRYCFDRYIWKSQIKDRHLHGFFQRALQLQLCIIYFFAGLAKLLGSGWWNGENLWMALTRPPFNVLPEHLIVSFYWILPIAGISVCFLEIGYPFFIWPKRTRLVWLVSVIAMHVGIGLTMGLYLFALIMIILNVAAFGPGTLFSESAKPIAAELGEVEAKV